MKFIQPLSTAFLFLTIQGFASATVTAPAANPQTGQSLAVVNTTLEGVRVFPNPWRADKDGSTQVTFDHLPAQSTVKIFTVSGHEVQTLSADSTGSTSWDRTNDAGDKVASGIYLYLITDNQGNKTRGKLAIIR